MVDTSADPNVTIGGYPTLDRYFTGVIDEVVLFDPALSPLQVKQLYTLSAPSFEQPCGGVQLADNFRIAGDTDLDCDVDLSDVYTVADDWLATAIVPGDIIIDENVNVADFSALAENYQVSFTPWLMAHLAFDETEGAAARDSSVNGYNAVVVNSDDSAWVEGKVGNVLEFDGIDDDVRIYNRALSIEEIAELAE